MADLNFKKVLPLFKDYDTKCLLAQNIPEKEVLKINNIFVTNPLYNDLLEED